MLILSHLHLDHTGGFEKLLDKIKIDRIFEAGQKTINKESRIVDSLVTARKIIRDFIETGDMIEIIWEFENLLSFSVQAIFNKSK